MPAAAAGEPAAAGTGPRANPQKASPEITFNRRKPEIEAIAEDTDL
jgi:hypothetical protein